MWIDIETNELAAVVEAAEKGQKVGGLTRSAKRLDTGLEILRKHIEFQRGLEASRAGVPDA